MYAKIDGTMQKVMRKKAYLRTSKQLPDLSPYKSYRSIILTVVARIKYGLLQSWSIAML